LDFDALVSADGSRVRRAAFDSEEVYARERTAIFEQCWLYVGHMSQIPNPGDFLTTYMGDTPVIVANRGDGQISVMLNSCTHRGRRVCQSDCGNARSFQCPYHAWTYGLDGSLRNVPHREIGYGDVLDESSLGLRHVAQIANYKGMIWATWNAHAPSFTDYLGDFRVYLDLMIDRDEGGIEVLPAVQRWRIPANWKFFVENNSPDLYHVSFTHASNISRDGLTKPYGNNENAYTVCAGEGHSTGGQRYGLSGGDEMPAKYYEYVKGFQERIGQERGAHFSQVVPIGVGVIFPNFCFLDTQRIRTFRLAQPRGPHEMELHSWVVVDRDMPDELKQDVRLQYTRLNGPGGVFEQDDVDNWSSCSESTQWSPARDLDFNYQLGLGKEVPAEEALGPGLPGTCGTGYTETALRNFYRRWGALMSGAARVG
jgi:phenylpropionate dioxygenase-like ring-hydroxylating dioxygenase large terminal subunit